MITLQLGILILDKQIVDTFGKKVVRVNDLTMVKINKDLKITHASIGKGVSYEEYYYLKNSLFYQKLFFPRSRILKNDTLTRMAIRSCSPR